MTAKPSSSQPIGLAGWRRATANPTAAHPSASTTVPHRFANDVWPAATITITATAAAVSASIKPAESTATTSDAVPREAAGRRRPVLAVTAACPTGPSRSQATRYARTVPETLPLLRSREVVRRATLSGRRIGPGCLSKRTFAPARRHLCVPVCPLARVGWWTAAGVR
jgi:hypothetical protein